MDRLSPDLLVNPRSPACSSPFTITPCAFCHLAVFCLQSYSAHLSDTIYGAQFSAWESWVSGEIYFPICCIFGTDALGDKLSICLLQISGRITTCFDATAADCALSPGMRWGCLPWHIGGVRVVCFPPPSGGSNISWLVMSCHQLCLIQ